MQVNKSKTNWNIYYTDSNQTIIHTQESKLLKYQRLYSGHVIINLTIHKSIKNHRNNFFAMNVLKTYL